MAPSALLPGFRFHPTDVELVVYYLKRKVMGRAFLLAAISEIDIYKYAPWDLPEKSCLKSKDLEWYFFCPRERKYTNSSRNNRCNDIGYWKATGKDRTIIHNSRTVGTKKTLVFHIGKSPRGDRTDWVMYEYRLDDKTLVNTEFSQDSYALCKIFQKSGLGPKNGEQYGAPFDEEEWEHDAAFENAISLPSVLSHPEPLNAVVSEPVIHQPEASPDGYVSSLFNLFDDDDGALEHLAEILNSSLLHQGAEGETPGNEIYGTETEGMYNELKDLFDQDVVGVTNSGRVSHDAVSEYALQPLMSEVRNELYMELNDLHFLEENSGYVSHDTVNEYALQPLMSELGNELYMELNDLQFLEENNPSEMIMPSDMFALDSFCRGTNLQNLNDTGNPTCNNTTVAPVLRDPLPQRSDTFSELLRFIQEVDESGTCLSQLDSNGCQLEDP